MYIEDNSSFIRCHIKSLNPGECFLNNSTPNAKKTYYMILDEKANDYQLKAVNLSTGEVGVFGLECSVIPVNKQHIKIVVC